MSEPISLALSIGFGYAALASYAYLRSNNAISPEAQFTRKAVAELLESKEQSRSLFGEKAQAISLINELTKECSDDDWDGYGAMALDPLAARNAEELIRALPDNLPMPDISPEPDGSISLDWNRSRNQIVSVSVGSSNRFALAWLDGTERGQAVVNFDGSTIPHRLLSAIRLNSTHGQSAFRFA